MDIEWAKNGDTGRLYIVQARPETVQSRKAAGTLKSYTLKEEGEPLLRGISIGQAIAAGEACVIESTEEIDRFKEGTILVTEMTDPDWVPIMKKAAGIVTDAGGRTCHAAIVSRELGIPAVVGTATATDTIDEDRPITMSCAEGDEGIVYDGILDFDSEEIDLEDLPQTRTGIMMNAASPSAALRWWRLPCEGIGLARMEFMFPFTGYIPPLNMYEFIINNVIKIHPMALVRYDTLEDEETKKEIASLTKGYPKKSDYFVDHLARGIATIAAPQYPAPVIVRLSDFKTNEYADLIGGSQFEPRESNPMLGFRGASRYYNAAYEEGFALECRAIRRVRETIGLENIIVMVPFCRTVAEARKVLDTMADHGLVRGEKGLQVYVMAEIPANIIPADQFAEHFDGFSLGSNDLTQLILGVDRDSAQLADLFDEQNAAVCRAIRQLIETAHKAGKKVGLCGQAPSDHPEFASFLVEAGIDTISLNPDSVVKVIRRVAETEKQMRR